MEEKVGVGAMLLMVFLTLGVVVGLFMVLRFFFNRLGAVQRARWGDLPPPNSELSFTEAMERIKNLSQKKL